MKALLLFPVFFIITISCKQSEAPASTKPDYEVRTYEYDSLTIPAFFSTLIENHRKDYWQFDSTEYLEFCDNHSLLPEDSSNARNYYSIKILHDLFTSQTSSDCSRGEILDIPYYWHWVNPNPRHQLRFAANGELVVNTKPPKEFPKYNSYADIDRTPYLYLTDLLHKTPKYCSPSCDTFSTFGWCSEREMAFTALMKTLDFESKVVAEGAHSWSEVVVQMKNDKAELQSFRVKVDNTYNIVDWTPINNEEVPAWKAYFGGSKFASWYNKSASGSELERIAGYVADKEGMKRIEKRLVKYLERKN